ncbi:MAG: recombinase family protein [Micropepsaceae bacterium]
MNGAKDRTERPQLEALIKDAYKRKFDVVACWSIDKLGRSIQTLVQFMNDMNAKQLHIGVGKAQKMLLEVSA